MYIYTYIYIYFSCYIYILTYIVFNYTYEFFGLKAYVIKHISPEKITGNHKEQISHVNDFSAFLYKGRYKNLGSLKFVFRYAC